MPTLGEMREKLAAMRAHNDAQRGRPLTPAEQLANLEHELERICVCCGSHVEPACDCIDCGQYNPPMNLED